MKIIEAGHSRKFLFATLICYTLWRVKLFSTIQRPTQISAHLFGQQQFFHHRVFPGIQSVEVHAGRKP